jgi:hypothetical protein
MVLGMGFRRVWCGRGEWFADVALWALVRREIDECDKEGNRPIALQEIRNRCRHVVTSYVPRDMKMV